MFSHFFCGEGVAVRRLRVGGRFFWLLQTFLFMPIDLVTVFDAILTSRQTCEKLQCLC